MGYLTTTAKPRCPIRKGPVGLLRRREERGKGGATDRKV